MAIDNELELIYEGLRCVIGPTIGLQGKHGWVHGTMAVYYVGEDQFGGPDLPSARIMRNVAQKVMGAEFQLRSGTRNFISFGLQAGVKRELKLAFLAAIAYRIASRK